MAHACLFDANDDGEYRKDSQHVCKLASDNDRVNILEIDIRKSKEGILYCYHGNLFEYYVLLHFFKRPMAYLRKKYKVNTLAAILDVVDEQKMLFLDLKEKSITREDILEHFANRTFKEVMLANKSPRFLDRFHDMPTYFVKRFNGNIFCTFYNLEKLKRRGFKYFEAVFPFQVNERIMKKVQTAGMEFCFTGMFFFSQKGYWNKVRKYDIKYVISDHIEDNFPY